MQAYSPHIPVGAQHYYKNSFDALRTILKSDGFFGLWRGVSTAILRTAMVSRLLSIHSKNSSFDNVIGIICPITVIQLEQTLPRLFRRYGRRQFLDIPRCKFCFRCLCLHRHAAS